MCEEKTIMVSDLKYDQEEIDAVVDVLRSEWLTMGPKTNEFEKRLGSYIGVKHVIAVSNGTAALHLSLLGLGVGPGDEVVVTPFTFVASVNAILYTGARPVFADIDHSTLNISPEDIRKKITQKTKAILPVHLAGLPAEADYIREIAEEHDVSVLYDGAHAIGASYKGKKVGTLGNVTAFSFFSNKNLPVGEGGAITTDNDELAEKVRLLRSHGMTKSTWSRHHDSNPESFDQLYDMVVLGYNYRITEINAALGIVQLKKLDAFNRRRFDVYRLYRELTTNLPIEFQHIPDYVKHAHHILPVLVPSGLRGKVRKELASRGIATSIHYTPVYKFTYYQKLGYSSSRLENAEDAGKRVVTLPLHQNLSDEDVHKVCSELKQVLE